MDQDTRLSLHQGEAMISFRPLDDISVPSLGPIRATKPKTNLWNLFWLGKFVPKGPFFRVQNALESISKAICIVLVESESYFLIMSLEIAHRAEEQPFFSLLCLT